MSWMTLLQCLSGWQPGPREGHGRRMYVRGFRCKTLHVIKGVKQTWRRRVGRLAACLSSLDPWGPRDIPERARQAATLPQPPRSSKPRPAEGPQTNVVFAIWVTTIGCDVDDGIVFVGRSDRLIAGKCRSCWPANHLGRTGMGWMQRSGMFTVVVEVEVRENELFIAHKHEPRASGMY